MKILSISSHPKMFLTSKFFFRFTDIPNIGQRCLQTFSGSTPKIVYNPSLFVINSIKNTKFNGDKLKSLSKLEYNFAALNITNGNVIPPTINPPFPLQRIEDPNKDERRNVETPVTIEKEITEKNLDNMLSFDLPPIEGQIDSYEAAVMIEIRRQKMKKHKYKKLQKKMKFIFAKRKVRRQMKKEKEFQALLLSQIHEAERFSAEEYVQDKLIRLKEKPIRKPTIIKIF